MIDLLILRLMLACVLLVLPVICFFVLGLFAGLTDMALGWFAFVYLLVCDVACIIGFADLLGFATLISVCMIVLLTVIVGFLRFVCFNVVIWYRWVRLIRIFSVDCFVVVWLRLVELVLLHRLVGVGVFRLLCFAWCMIDLRDWFYVWWFVCLLFSVDGWFVWGQVCGLGFVFIGLGLLVFAWILRLVLHYSVFGFGFWLPFCGFDILVRLYSFGLCDYFVCVV